MSDRSTVAAVMAAAGLPVTDDELTRLTDAYAALRPALDALYRVPDELDAESALIFDPDPHGLTWAMS